MTQGTRKKGGRRTKEGLQGKGEKEKKRTAERREKEGLQKHTEVDESKDETTNRRKKSNETREDELRSGFEARQNSTR